MKEFPIKERGWRAHQHEIKAILDSRQTQFRRVIRPQPILTKARGRQIIGDEFHIWPAGIIRRKSLMIRAMISKCPYGRPSDRLWVRETFGIDPLAHRPGHKKILYRATQNIDADYPIKWKPPIHMPRGASRITLEVVNVRVERIQEISRADAEAEGIEKEWDGSAHWYKDYNPNAKSMYKQQPTKSFMTLWDFLNAKRSYAGKRIPGCG